MEKHMYQGCAAARAGKHRSIRSGGGKSSSLEPGWQAGGVDTTTCHFEGNKCSNYPIFFYIPD